MNQTLSKFEISEIIEGEAPGADTLAREWAEDKGIPVRKFPANWTRYGRAAGPIRNAQMLEEGQPDLVIAFIAPDSRGTKNMIEKVKEAGISLLTVELIGDGPGGCQSPCQFNPR